MQPVPEGTIKRFAQAFCFGHKGYSLKDLGALFPTYGMQVPAIDSRLSPAKVEFFCTCLRSLSPRQQRQLLYDLCDNRPLAFYDLPPEEVRLELLRELSQADGVSPLGVSLSSLTAHATRQQWFTAASRLSDSPAAAVTAARALVETTCKTVLTERGQAPTKSGNLTKVFKQTAQALGIKASAGAAQGASCLINGLVQALNALATISNLAGDRHGLAGGNKITDHSLASLAVHVAGTVSLFIVQVHRASLRTQVGT